MKHRIRCALVLAMLVLAPAVPATPTDFNFSGVELSAVMRTIGVLGKFNVLVEPELGTLVVDYHRAKIEPIDALKEAAQVAGGVLQKVNEGSSPIYLVTRTPLPAGLTPPEANGPPTDFSFNDVPVRDVAQTIAVLGKFDFAIGQRAPSKTLRIFLKQVDPAQAFFWVGTVAGYTVERSDKGARPLYTLKAR